MDLGLDVLSVESTAIVTCTGRIVHGETARRFHACAARLIARHRRVLLDLRGVTCADARGLGTLASLLRLARARRCVVLATANERLERLLHVTRLDAYIRGVTLEGPDDPAGGPPGGGGRSRARSPSAPLATTAS